MKESTFRLKILRGGWLALGVVGSFSFYRLPPQSHRLVSSDRLFPMAGACYYSVIYIINASKMKATTTSAAIDNNTENRNQFSVGLVLGGIVTAILCVLALLYDTYSNSSTKLPGFIESSSVSKVSELITSANMIVSQISDSVISITTSFFPSLLSI